jgi:hypothetical protein
VAEHAYLTDAIPAAAGNVGTAVLGVSALMALDDRRLWVLERAGVAIDDVFENRLRIYQVDVSRALDVSQKPSVTTSDALPKSLVLDLDDVTARLHPPKLDNFEGMALGPRTEKGQRSVVLVSDDNFKATQRTALVAFALEE